MADKAGVPSIYSNSSLFHTCSHRRLIDNVFSEDGTATDKVRCVECGAVFDDSHCRPE